MAHITLLLLFIAVFSSSVLAHRINCTIEGLPDSTRNYGNVFLIKTNVSTMQLSLRCRCSFFTPLWNKYEIKSQTFQNVNNNIQCFNTTNPENNTKCLDTVLVEPKPNIILENRETFNITEPTVLMCYSISIRQTVVVSMSSDDEDQLESTIRATNSSTSRLQVIHSAMSSAISPSSQSSVAAPSTSSSLYTDAATISRQQTTVSADNNSATHSNMIMSTKSISSPIVFTTTISPIPSSELDVTIGRVGTAEKIVDTVGIPGLIGIPVIAISLLLNFILISWIVRLKRKKSNYDEDRYIKQLEVEGGVSTDNSSRSNSLESSHMQSTDKLLSLTAASRSRSNIYSTPRNFANSNGNNNNNNNSNHGLRTSQSDIVISNYSVNVD